MEVLDRVEYVSSVYKRGRTRELEVLLSSASMSQLFVRTEYLRRFSEQRREDAERISRKRADIEDRQAKLQLELADERRLIAEKGSEEDRLTALVSDRKDVLGQIRKDKKNLQRELDRKMAAAKEIENLIANLIEADRIRREKEARGRPEGRAAAASSHRRHLRAAEGKTALAGVGRRRANREVQ